MDIEKLTASIIEHEGMRLYVYDDATGLPIKQGHTVQGNPTIGVGRLLTAQKGISNIECMAMLSTDIQAAIATAEAQAWWPMVSPSDARSRAFVEILFNLGLGRFNGFTKALADAMASDWPACSAELLNSLWAQQVGERAGRLAAMVATGEDPVAA
jgi:lysozyme